ncbi:cyclic diguanylate phosphodiesterase [Escherichia coli]|nr:cyclic diguanylate phosphodiesterase [Escherichia coli]
MQKAQRIIKTYRRNRMIVCTICALVTLASTLSVRFISQRNLNQQRVVQFANHAVEELDKVLLPLQAGSEVLLPLIGLPCSVAHLPLRKQAAKLQTVRSIGLVQDGTLYCSSIFGYRNVPVVDILAELPAPQPLLRLTIDRALIKGSPVLIQWTPAAGSSNAGVMEMINIIALGQRLNIELVAEGVETQEQAKYLRRHGVHILQGYLYAQPMPLRDFPKWLAGSQPPPARHNGHITPIMPLR